MTKSQEQLIHDKLQLQAYYRQHIPIEGKLRQGNRAYWLNLMQAKTTRTTKAWINITIFFVLKLLVQLWQQCQNNSVVHQQFHELLLPKTKLHISN